MLKTFRIHTVCLSFMILLSLILSGSGICRDVHGDFMGYGVGGESCGKFIEKRRNRQDTGYMHWVTGYLTAINLERPMTYNILGTTDIHGAMLWLENYCQRYPLIDVNDAVDALADELYPKRATQKKNKSSH